jgi:hypothetical protein
LDFFTLSPTQAVCRRAKAREFVFSGSSLNRKKYEPKKKETIVQIGKTDHRNPQLQLKIDLLRNDPAFSGKDHGELSDRGGLLDALLDNSGDTGTKRSRLSVRSKRKIQNKCLVMFDAYRSTTGFTLVTLSFINTVSDKMAVKILNTFLTQVRKTDKNFQYLWVAERQDGKRNEYEHSTNNIHFHLLCNKRWNIQRFNSLWTLAQYNAGLTFTNAAGHTYSTIEINQMHGAGKIHEILNPADFKKVNSIDAMAGYLTKYVTKNDEEFDCRSWHCSRGVSEQFTTVIIPKAVFDEALGEKNNGVNKETGEVYEPKLYEIKQPKKDIHGNKISETTVALMVFVQNKAYFRTKLKYLHKINQWLAQGMKLKREDVMTIDAYSYHESYVDSSFKKLCIQQEYNLVKNVPYEYEKVKAKGSDRKRLSAHF